MYSIRIIGAGSIGNHLANAARSRGWQVTLTDNDPAALDRARSDIYPSRYGAWDDEIVLKDSRASLGDAADVVFIGTPPDSHIALANAVLDAAKPRLVVLEKPVCGPGLEGADALHKRLKSMGVIGTVGYNHVVGQNTVLAEAALAGRRARPHRDHLGAHPRALGRHLQGPSLARRAASQLSRLFRPRRRGGGRAFPRHQYLAAFRPSRRRRPGGGGLRHPRHGGRERLRLRPLVPCQPEDRGRPRGRRHPGRGDGPDREVDAHPGPRRLSRMVRQLPGPTPTPSSSARAGRRASRNSSPRPAPMISRPRSPIWKRCFRAVYPPPRWRWSAASTPRW